MLLFKCPVCNQPLEKKERVLCCKNNHSYDIAKKGYINLLLANQGNHFLEEGDKKDAVVARTTFLNTGVYDYLRQEIIKTMKSYFGDEPFNFCDLACGEGYYTTEIHQNFPEIQTYGVDISKAAITALCTRKNMLGLQNFHMAIGNLDYLPFVDESFDCLLNCFAPINKTEFKRICRQNGIYIRVLPGPNHLLEMKEALYENVRLNEPKEENLEGFTLIDKKIISNVTIADNYQIKALLDMTPYAVKTSPQAKEKLFSTQSMKLTTEFSIFVFKKL